MIEEMKEEKLYLDIPVVEDLIEIMKELEKACEEDDLDKKAELVEEIEKEFGLPTFELDILFETAAVHIDEECKVSLYLPVKIPY